MTHPDSVMITALFRAQASLDQGALFSRLMNALCRCGHAITSAELRDNDLRVALDGHAFTLTQSAHPLTLGRDRNLYRPDEPFAMLPAGRLGYAVTRHQSVTQLRFDKQVPDGPVKAFVAAVFAQQHPDALLWHPGQLVLTLREFLGRPLSMLRSAERGALLPLPLPRYARPGAMSDAAARSVFSCRHPRNRAAARTAPNVVHVINDTPAQTWAGDQPRRSVFSGRGAAASGTSGGASLPLAADDAATLAARLRVPAPCADQPARVHSLSGAGPMGPRDAAPNLSGVLVLPAPVCDGLTIRDSLGRNRTVSTALMTMWLFVEMAAFTLRETASLPLLY